MTRCVTAMQLHFVINERPLSFLGAWRVGSAPGRCATTAHRVVDDQAAILGSLRARKFWRCRGLAAFHNTSAHQEVVMMACRHLALFVLAIATASAFTAVPTRWPAARVRFGDGHVAASGGELFASLLHLTLRCSHRTCARIFCSSNVSRVCCCKPFWHSHPPCTADTTIAQPAMHVRKTQ
jgi:hypothetical protein